MNTPNEIKLHLGCGNIHIDGYVNVDIRNLPGVDVVDDVSTLSSFEENSVDIIYVCHVLEHFEKTKYKGVIKRWYDLLKKRGVLRVAVPDFEAVAEYYSKNRNLEDVLGLLFGGQDYEQNFHYCCWDFKKMQIDLMGAGFKNVKRYEWRQTDHSHFDDYSQAYLPHMEKETGKLMSLNVEAIK